MVNRLALPTSTPRPRPGSAWLALLVLVAAFISPAARWVGGLCVPAGPALVAPGASGGSCQLHAAVEQPPTRVQAIAVSSAAGTVEPAVAAALRPRRAWSDSQRPVSQTITPLLPPPIA